MSEDSMDLLRRIWRSPGWHGSVVIECAPETGIQVFWKTEEQGGGAPNGYRPDVRGVSILGALTIAADEADPCPAGGEHTWEIADESPRYSSRIVKCAECSAPPPEDDE